MNTQDKSFYLKQTEALKLALEPVMSVYITKDGIEDWWHKLPEGRYDLCDITAIREALAEQPAQQEQEPAVWKDEQGNVRMTLDSGEIQSSVGYVYSVKGERIKNACIRSDIPNGTPLYTSPPASKPEDK